MNINTIKERLASLTQKKPKYEKVDLSKYLWKPKVGKHTIRILPVKNLETSPFKEVFVHYGIAKYPMLALTNWGEKDPIVELSKDLIKSGDKENWKMGKKLEPKMRVYVPVIVRGEEDKGVRLWEFGKEIYLELLGMAEDEDIGDYTSITNGRDITVTTVGPETTGTSFNKSTIRVKPKTSAVSDDAELVKKWLSEQPDILSLYQKKTFEEMKEIVFNYLNPKVAEEAEAAAETEADVEETDPEEIEEIFQGVPLKQGKKTNSEAFSDLFGEKKK